MKILISAVCLLAFILSSYYAWNSGGVNFYATAIASLAALLTSIANIMKKSEAAQPSQKQNLKNQSIGNQSQGDINQKIKIGSMKNDTDTKN